MLEAVARNGGAVCVDFSRTFLDDQYRRATQALLQKTKGMRSAAKVELYQREKLPEVPLARLLDHIEHVARVAGADHVCLGSDFDNAPLMPVGLEDANADARAHRPRCGREVGPMRTSASSWARTSCGCSPRTNRGRRLAGGQRLAQRGHATVRVQELVRGEAAQAALTYPRVSSSGISSTKASSGSDPRALSQPKNGPGSGVVRGQRQRRMLEASVQLPEVNVPPMRMFNSGSIRRAVWYPCSLSLRASMRAVAGITCVSPSAPVGERARGSSALSSRINACKRSGAPPPLPKTLANLLAERERVRQHRRAQRQRGGRMTQEPPQLGADHGVRAAQVSGAGEQLGDQRQRLVPRFPGAPRGRAVHGADSRAASVLSPSRSNSTAASSAVTGQRAGVQRARRGRLQQPILRLLDAARPLGIQLRQPAPGEETVVGERAPFHQPDQVGAGSLRAAARARSLSEACGSSSDRARQ